MLREHTVIFLPTWTVGPDWGEWVEETKISYFQDFALTDDAGQGRE